MEIKRAYKFRFYPTFEQETILAQTFGCARFVYNR
ncbi:helix-turn-helix domain-containing protein, partial [Nitrosomonas cryotolerans]